MAATSGTAIRAPTAVNTTRSRRMMTISGGHTSAGHGLVAKDGTQFSWMPAVEPKKKTT